MAIYIVGDVQGCYDELIALLKQVNFNSKHDELWLAGDLVARGPKSLETLQFVKSLGNQAKIVLGNHDLHLLATYYGIKKVKPQDKLDKLLSSPDIDELMEWLAQQPLIQKLPNDNAYMSHAGISPQWTIDLALKNAKFAHKKISSSKRKKWLSLMYGEKPNDWFEVQDDISRFRYTINAFTRMRYCFSDGTLDFTCKADIKNAPDNLLPWYELSETINTSTWIFGHWAALMGHCSKENIYALDTGCVWGQHLTMLRWQDKKLFKQHALNRN